MGMLRARKTAVAALSVGLSVMGMSAAYATSGDRTVTGPTGPEQTTSGEYTFRIGNVFLAMDPDSNCNEINHTVTVMDCLRDGYFNSPSHIATDIYWSNRYYDSGHLYHISEGINFKS